MSRENISQGRALLSGIVIFVYFAVTTAWIPSMLLRSSLLATAPENVASGITLVVWGGFFGFGLLALRMAQERELI